MLILGLLGVYFDALVVFVTSQTLLLRFAVAILWRKVQKIHIISVSCNCNCMTFIFKICQTVAGIGIISQFHEFSILIFGWFLLFGPPDAAIVSKQH